MGKGRAWTVVRVATVLLVVLAVFGCSTTYGNADGSHTATFEDGTVSAYADIESTGKKVLIEIRNTSESVIEVLWNKASFKGSLLIDAMDYDEAGAQPIAPTLLQGGGSARKLLVLKAAVTNLGHGIYKIRPWAENADGKDIVIAYTVDGQERFVTL